MLKKVVIILSLVLSLVEFVNARAMFDSQWISLNIGKTNNTFKDNSGNKGGIGVIYNANISSSVFRQIFITLSTSRIKEYQAPMYDVYNPIEYFNQKSIMFGRYFVMKDFCLLPSVGYCWMDGINRGKWVGVPGIESYSCESLPYKSNGISWAFQLNSNANGWLGVGLLFSGIVNSKKDYFGISLLFKIGKQYIK